MEDWEIDFENLRRDCELHGKRNRMSRRPPSDYGWDNICISKYNPSYLERWGFSGCNPYDCPKIKKEVKEY